jgi:hypothetical protein
MLATALVLALAATAGAAFSANAWEEDRCHETLSS